MLSSNLNTDVAVFGGGCFWCTEAVFNQVRGVISVIPGYAGGNKERPTYEEVCNGTTGHAEVIKVEFDSSQVSYRDLLGIFFGTHNPTTLNRQGADFGEQYRSVILTTSTEQTQVARKFIDELSSAGDFGAQIVTVVAPLTQFYEAEGYHRRYYEQNPDAGYCQAVISPKLAKFRAKYAHLLKP
jgi:peptide-methionine (S)-S-oxide reductase